MKLIFFTQKFVVELSFDVVNWNTTGEGVHLFTL